MANGSTQAREEVHYHNDGGESGTNPLVIFMVLLLILVLLFLFFFLYQGAGRFFSSETPQIAVPEQIDVNVNNPQGSSGQ